LSLLFNVYFTKRFPTTEAKKTASIFSCAVYTVFEKKQSFFYNFVKFLPTLIIFGTKVAKTIELCKVVLFSASPNLHQRTIM